MEARLKIKTEAHWGCKHHPQRLHGTGIFTTFIYHKCKPLVHVGKYSIHGEFILLLCFFAGTKDKKQ